MKFFSITFTGGLIQAWKAVSISSPEIHPSIIEVSPDGKIDDQMKEKLARTMLSANVISHNDTP